MLWRFHKQSFGDLFRFNVSRTVNYAMWDVLIQQDVTGIPTNTSVEVKGKSGHVRFHFNESPKPVPPDLFGPIFIVLRRKGGVIFTSDVTFV